MPSTTQLSTAGLERAFLTFVDDDLLMTGMAFTLPAGSDVGMHDLLGIESSDYQAQEAVQVDILGNDTAIRAYLFRSQTSSQGSMTLGILDLQASALAIGDSVVTFAGGAKAVNFNPNVFANKTAWIVFCSQGTIEESANAGTGGYVMDAYSVRLVPRYGNGKQNQTATQFTFDLVEVQTARNFLGHLLSDTAVFNYGSVTRSGGLVGMWYPNKRIAHRFRGDGSATTFTLDYTPINIPNGIQAYKLLANGTYSELTYDAITAGAGEFAVNAGTKTITLGDTLTSDDNVFVWYERA